MVVSHGTAIRTITTYATGVDGGFSGYLTNCRYIVIKSGEADFDQGDLVRWANTGSKQMYQPLVTDPSVHRGPAAAGS